MRLLLNNYTYYRFYLYKNAQLTDFRAKKHPQLTDDEESTDDDDTQVRLASPRRALGQVNWESKRLQETLQLLWN